MGGHQLPNEGQTNEWMTPPHILEALGSFDDDPSIRGESGLNREWVGRVWINPPYGPHTGHWMRRLAMHGNGIALLFARTETKMFFHWVWDCADGVLFIRGRLRFLRPDGTPGPWTAGAPSVLVGYGAQNVEALRNASTLGRFIALRNLA